MLSKCVKPKKDGQFHCILISNKKFLYIIELQNRKAHFNLKTKLNKKCTGKK